MPATLFAHGLSRRFAMESAKENFSEVAQFRALIRAFGGAGPQFHVEEYHGPKHQVIFNGQGAWGRSPARCELCDVLFIAYRIRPSLEIRITFLQAKRSKENHSTACSSYPGKLDAINFKANLEQWDLLARRPPLLPHPPFEAPPTLLSAALLPSIGSFGVFHRRGRGVEFFYVSADHLKVVGSPSTKNGRLETDSAAVTIRKIGAHTEVVYCCCLPLFARELYSLRIGSPLEAASLGLAHSPLAHWLAQVMAQYRMERPDSVAAQEILEGLRRQDVNPEDQIPEGAFLMPSLVLVRSEVNPDDL